MATLVLMYLFVLICTGSKNVLPNVLIKACFLRMYCSMYWDSWSSCIFRLWSFFLHSGAFWRFESVIFLQPRWKIPYSGAFWRLKSQNFLQPRWKVPRRKSIKNLHSGAFLRLKSQKNFLQPRWKIPRRKSIKNLRSGVFWSLLFFFNRREKFLDGN